jgi:hypothetical protein
MDTKDWTERDWELAAIYGTCWTCGAPRCTKTSITQERDESGPVTVRHVALVCSRFEEHNAA